MGGAAGDRAMPNFVDAADAGARAPVAEPEGRHEGGASGAHAADAADAASPAALHDAGPPAPIQCPGGGEAGSLQNVPFSSQGRDTYYLLYVPQSYSSDEPAPVVLNWHGLTSSGQAQATISNTTEPALNEVADQHGFLVVTPNSDSQSWNGGACCGQAMRDGIDEVAFARALVADVQTRVCVDHRRVYSTGYSNGGFLSHHLACQASDLIAAIAPVAAVLGYDDSDCTPSLPVGVMQIHGTGDSLIPYEGGSSLVGGPFRSVVDSTAGWVARNGCVGEPVETYRNGNATCMTWSGCAPGGEVSLCTAEGANHCWPGWASCVFGRANDLAGAQEMWSFFRRFQR
jgi:polyhydroxybutyrate depolymerase